MDLLSSKIIKLNSLSIMASKPGQFTGETLNTDPRAASTNAPAASPMLDIPTPPHCTADFCLIPLGTPSASVSKEVAEVQRLLKKSGLNYSMHSAGTTVGTLLND